MDKNTIKRSIIENREFINKTDVKKRIYKLDPGANYVFCGARRSGKSYSLYQIIQDNTQQQNSTGFVYINFEDERFIEFNHTHFDLILESVFELNYENPYFFFDEIQNIQGWEKFVRRLADKGQRIYITGSNAKMLSREMASTLGGRYLIKEVYPLSFTEFLAFQNFNLKSNYEFSDQRFLIKQNFKQYFYFGGFPELSKFQNPREYLSNVYMKVLYGDLIARNHIQNEQALRLIIKKLAESVNDETSLNRIKNLIISTGLKIGNNTIPEYLSYLQDAYLILPLQNFTSSFTEREVKKKYYFIDQGILSLFITDQDSKLLENIVFLQLYRRYKDQIHYYKRKHEVDFYIPEEQMLIQVCFSLSDIETKQRELTALSAAMKELKIQQALIITYDEEEGIELKNSQISVIPAWKWLLQ